MGYFDDWIAESEEKQRVYTQESLIVEISEAIHEIMNQKGVNRKELADTLKVSKARVSKMLAGSSNMTLRTLADICYALEVKPDFCLTPNEPEVLTSVIVSESYSPVSATQQYKNNVYYGFGNAA